MRILITALWTTYILAECSGINFIDLSSHRHRQQRTHKIRSNKVPAMRASARQVRRGGIVKEKHKSEVPFLRTNYDEEKDTNLKNKISTLVQQTLFDTERKIKSVQELKENNRDKLPYRAGFVLCMIKKTRDVLNELFNVAVKHRDEWKALEQLKIFELIVHTNVDTTHLVRQLVEVHVTHLNSTNSRRVVLL